MNQPHQSYTPQLTPLTYDEIIRKQLQPSLEVTGLIPLPMQGDPLVRLKSLQEMIEDLEDSDEEGSFHYLIQVRPPKKNASVKIDIPAEGIYLKDGKLNTNYLLKNADLLFEARDYALARNIYKTVLQSGDHPSVIRIRLARCFEAEGRLPEACEWYEDAITFHPSLDAFRALSKAYSLQSKEGEAVEVMERALQLKDLKKEDRFEFHKACGNIWTRLKKIKEAENHFRSALECYPSADDVQTNLGLLYLQEKRLLEARRSFQDALAGNSKNAAALTGLGSCCLSEGDYKGAHELFAQTLSLDLNNPTALLLLIKCAYQIKSYSLAAQHLEDYVQFAPIHPNLLYSLSGLQFHLGRMTEARRSALKVLELHPKHSGAQELLKRMDQFSQAGAL